MPSSSLAGTHSYSLHPSNPPSIHHSPSTHNSPLAIHSLSPSTSSSHHTHSPSPFSSLSLKLKPSSSVGPFRLGLPLWHTLDYLRSNSNLFPQVHIKYDASSPLHSPIVLSILPNLNLVFHGTTQRLVIITLDDLDLPSQPGPSLSDPSHRPINLIYNNRLIRSPGVDLTRSSLHQLLGPTYPGWIQPRLDGLSSVQQVERNPATQENEFVLGYPGVAFCFRMPVGDLKSSESKEAGVGKHQRVATIHVFRGTDPREPEEVVPSFNPPKSSPSLKPVPSPSAKGKNSYSSSPVIDRDDQGSVRNLALEEDAINIRAPCCTEALIEPGEKVVLNFGRSSSSRTSSPMPPAEAGPGAVAGSSAPSPPSQSSRIVELLIGVTTPQDALCDLGEPQRVFYKEDERMRIHGGETGAFGSGGGREACDFRDRDEPDSEWNEDGGGAGSEETIGSPFFFNYFDLGIDLLFSTSSSSPTFSIDRMVGQARLEKVVLHTNVAGDGLFQRYNRCPWKIVGPSRRSTTPSPDSAGQSKRKGSKSSAKVTAGAMTKIFSFSDVFEDSSIPLPDPSNQGGSRSSGHRSRDRNQLGGSEGMDLDRGTSFELGGAPQGSAATTTTVADRGSWSSPRRDLSTHSSLPPSATQSPSLRPTVSPSPSTSARAGPTEGSENRPSDSRVQVRETTDDGGGGGGKLKLDVSTKLIGRPGLVLEVSRFNNVVGVVVF
ncbi:hypothetical protein IE53DRAFT_361007 [Violaceomyces palustris]|uniref:Uncharacterized protein n=1 Tax=Violaceomyces palustris TaxID=1673888 RepID=A0ACD0P2D8_9BASI|nr:hypothetical protein IE53DRAFT_361007 [Violaceomyces palustris]